MKRLTIYPTARTSIEIIPQKRMATGSHVHADLMRAPCFQAKGEKRHIRRCAQALPSCHGTLSIRPDAGAGCCGPAKDRCIPFPSPLRSDSRCTERCTPFRLFLPGRMRKGILSQHNQSGGIPDPNGKRDETPAPPRARGDGPAQHLPGCPDHGRGTDKPAWHWAFHDKQAFIFKHDGKGDRLRFHRTGRRCDGKRDAIPAFQDGARRGRFPLHRRPPSIRLAAVRRRAEQPAQLRKKTFERGTAIGRRHGEGHCFHDMPPTENSRTLFSVRLKRFRFFYLTS